MRCLKGTRRTGILIKLLLLSAIFALCFPQAVLAEVQQYVIDENSQWFFPIPLAYRHVKVIEYLGEKGQFLNGPEDLFLDRDDFLYVVDTQNNRVLKLTTEGETLAVFTGPEDKPLKNPRGIYVDKDGDMYIADTGNNRILHLAPDGRYVEEFIKPESKLLSEDFFFDPSKVFISSTGYLFVIQSQAFLSMDANNEFRGYVGATQVGFDFQRLLIRIFATEEQKVRVAKKLPDSYSNFVIDDRGMIYATVINAETNQIRKITPAGKNIFPSGFYGEITMNDKGVLYPLFVDIAVDKNGIISVIDQVSGKVFQYDQEGNNLAVFGGIGGLKGMFRIPSSLVVDSKGRIYVLDQEAGNIQVFEPTNFIKLVHQAATLYNDGNYAESRKVWEEVLKIDANYSLAHRGVAKALLKEGKWEESMQRYRLANDKEGYSEAYKQYRHAIFRKYFGWVVLGVALLCMALVMLVRFAKRTSEAILRKHMGW